MTRDHGDGINYLREILFALFAYWRVAVLAALPVLVVSLAVSFLYPPDYQADGAFLIKAKRVENAPGALESTELRVMPLTKEDLNSEVEILISGEVIGAAVRGLLADGRLPPLPDKTTEEALGSYMYKIGLALTTEVVPGSNVINIALTWKDPTTAGAILGSVMAQYLDYRRSLMAPKEMQAFFTQHVDNYRQAMEGQEDALLALMREHRTGDPQSEIINNQERLTLLQQQIDTMELQRLQLAAVVTQLDAALARGGVQFFTFVDNPGLRELSGRLQQLVLQQNEIEKGFLPASPPAQEARAAVAAAQAELDREIAGFRDTRKAELTALDQGIAKLDEQIRLLTERNLALKQVVVQAEAIRKEADLLSYSYETFSKRREEAVLDQAQAAMGLQTQVLTLRPAKANTTPVFPNPKRLLILGVIAAVFTGISMALLQYFFDYSIRRPEDVERISGIPVLCSLFEDEPVRRRHKEVAA